MSGTPLAVIRGLTYFDPRQVFNRWLIPTYEIAFRWTGNRTDSEDATASAMFNIAGHVSLPELVQVVDSQVEEAALEAVVLHWAKRYGIEPARCTEMLVAAPSTAVTTETLFERLTAELRLILVLRFVRRRGLSAIAAQFGIPQDAARQLMVEALAQVAERVGFRMRSRVMAQTDHVSRFVDDIIARRKPIRFDVQPETWPALVGAAQIQAAIAGNSIPKTRFVTSLERRLVTSLRIWSA
jgi:sigma-70-like protein